LRLVLEGSAPKYGLVNGRSVAHRKTRNAEWLEEMTTVESGKPPRQRRSMSDWQWRCERKRLSVSCSARLIVEPSFHSFTF
jgi:hypothetical protein